MIGSYVNVDQKKDNVLRKLGHFSEKNIIFFKKLFTLYFNPIYENTKDFFKKNIHNVNSKEDQLFAYNYLFGALLALINLDS